MSAIFKNKRERIEKAHSIINTKDDLGMDVEIQIAYWNNPSRAVFGDLVDSIATPSEKLDAMDEQQQQSFSDKYFAAVTELLIESDLLGLDFNTVDETLASFEHPELPMQFMHKLVINLVLRILTEAGYVKNVSTALSNSGDSGSVE